MTKRMTTSFDQQSGMPSETRVLGQHQDMRVPQICDMREVVQRENYRRHLHSSISISQWQCSTCRKFRSVLRTKDWTMSRRSIRTALCRGVNPALSGMFTWEPALIKSFTCAILAALVRASHVQYWQPWSCDVELCFHPTRRSSYQRRYQKRLDQIRASRVRSSNRQGSHSVTNRPVEIHILLDASHISTLTDEILDHLEMIFLNSIEQRAASMFITLTPIVARCLMFQDDLLKYWGSSMVLLRYALLETDESLFTVALVWSVDFREDWSIVCW